MHYSIDEQRELPRSGVPDARFQPTMTVEEAARFLGIGRSTAFEAIRRGELPALHFGRRIVVPTAALCRLLEHGDQQ